MDNDKLWLVYIDTSTNTVVCQAWDGATGAPAVINAVQPGAVNAIHYMDAFSYAPGTVTVVVRANPANTRFLEFNSATGANVANVLLGFDSDIAISLLPDPDLSGVRFLAMSNTLPQVSVFRLTSAGAVLGGLIAEATTASQITGCAYSAGVDWQIVYGNGAGIRACKRLGGVVGAASATNQYGSIESVAWRDSGTDVMHYIVGIHGTTSDPQDSFLEMAMPFATGSTAIVDKFPEPQARLLPLQAGPSTFSIYPGHLVHFASTGFNQRRGSLLRQARFSQAAGASLNQYAVDMWQVSYLSPFSFNVVNQGPGTATDSESFLPVGSLLISGGGQLVSHGLSAIPFQPATAPVVGGALIASSTYNHLIVVEVPDETGNVWRSPPSTPKSTVLAAGQQGITVTVTLAGNEIPSRLVTVKIYRTKSNGSVYQLVNSRTGQHSALRSFVFGDGVADTALGDFLSAEVPATITPAFSHTAIFGNRLWGIERDFPNLWMSKPLQKGFQPEFPGVTPFVVNISDEYGVATALYSLNDKMLINKQNSIYTVTGDGPDNAGGGFAPVVTRVDSDVGSMPGTPVVSTGAEAYFVGQRGIFSIDQSSQISWVGADVDLYFKQQTAQIIAAVFSPTADEVRFIGMTSYGGTMTTLVYDRFRGIWYIDKGAGAGTSSSALVLSRMIGTNEVRYTNGGTMSYEAPSATDDGGVSFSPIIGSAWIRPAGNEGRIRLKRARVLGLTSSSGGSITPILTILWNYDESGTLFPNSESRSPAAPIADTANVIRAELAPRNQKCSAFRLQLTLPVGATTLRLEQWSAVVSIKPSVQKLNPAERWT
jgi:hypothetical protein